MTTTTYADQQIGPGLLAALGLLSAASPLAMDFYLASLPAAQASLHTSATSVQLTVTVFLVGIGCGQLFWGPVSDRFGRRRPLLLGCAVSVVAAVVAALAPTVYVLVAARLVQALAVSAAPVMSRAVIADLAQGPAAARAMSLMLTVNSVAPVVAPVFGGVLAGAGVSWRIVLAVVVVAMAAQLLAAVLVVPESLSAARRTTALRFGHVPVLLRRPAFIGYALTSMFAFGVVMAYISSSSFVYQRVIGTSGTLYGLGFAVNATGMIAGGLLSARAVRRGAEPASVISRALPVLAVCGLLVLLVAASPAPKACLAVPFLAMQVAMGFVMGNSAALAIGAAREIAGSASGVVGALNFLFGGAVSALGGLAESGTAVPVGIVMAASGLAACLAFALTHRAARVG